MIAIIITAFFLGIGLAADACAVSMANGLKEKTMKVKKILLIAFLFGLFQGLMPLIGYFVGASILSKIEWVIPWVALVLLTLIGGKMLIEGIKNEDEEKEKEDKTNLTFKVLLVQAFATSIDALSVGFTISNYKVNEALISASIISIVTAIICIFAVKIGKIFGTKLGNKAEIIGGIILMLIGIEIFVTGVFL